MFQLLLSVINLIRISFSTSMACLYFFHLYFPPLYVILGNIRRSTIWQQWMNLKKNGKPLKMAL